MPESSAAIEFDNAKERRRLPMIGLTASVAYFVMLVIYLIVQQQNPADLRLNELGDFWVEWQARLPSCGSCLAFSSRAVKFVSAARRSISKRRK